MSEPQLPHNASFPTATFAELFADIPLHSSRKIEGAVHPLSGAPEFPDEIRLHCENPHCIGIRRHVSSARRGGALENHSYYFVSYRCANCKSGFKIFGLRIDQEANQSKWTVCTKIFQEPQFGHPIPKRIFQIIGEVNRDHFLQARRAIARGLGIGAYAYYRRIVENNKFDLIDAVLTVAKATRAPTTQIDLLERAKTETQFSKAIDMVRDVSSIPPVLLIDGHNPLLLLHDLLSEGIHELTDAECLKRAQEAEIILCEIAERIQIAITERKEVKSALESILNRKSEKPS